jgi:putative hydrolase of the HAD superfamily
MAKPDARLYHLAAARLSVRPEEAIFVDDEPRNVEAARAVGMPAVHFRDSAQAITEIEEYLDDRRGQTE